MRFFHINRTARKFRKSHNFNLTLILRQINLCIFRQRPPTYIHTSIYSSCSALAAFNTFSIMLISVHLLIIFRRRFTHFQTNIKCFDDVINSASLPAPSLIATAVQRRHINQSLQFLLSSFIFIFICHELYMNCKIYILPANAKCLSALSWLAIKCEQCVAAAARSITAASNGSNVIITERTHTYLYRCIQNMLRINVNFVIFFFNFYSMQLFYFYFFVACDFKKKKTLQFFLCIKRAINNNNKKRMEFLHKKLTCMAKI